MRLGVIFGSVVGLGAAVVWGQSVYPTSPDWVSADRPVSTGGAFADINGDGWSDFVVSNGNDIRRERVAVYYNRGDGTYPSTPDWQSSDVGYNGHLDVADVNGDGRPDVAVGLLLNEGGPAAKLYLNRDGQLSPTPDWTSQERANCFGAVFGDVNADGRPDLAVMTGWPYGNPHIFKNTVHLNVNGALQTAPSWESDDTWGYNNGLWVDADDDGRLDLAGLGADTHTRIYRNLGGVLEGSDSWRTTDNPRQFAIMAAAGDVTGDGLRELFVTDNTQLFNGSGRFRQYNGRAQGFYSTTPDWSYYDGYGSAVALADVDADGRLDLATGAWWDNTRLFYNNGAGFNAAPSWNSAGTSVVEKIVLGDVNKDSLWRGYETFEPDGERRLFHLARQPIERITSVFVDGDRLGFDEYTFHREFGWVSVGRTPSDSVDVDYVYSKKLDMGVTNWDGSLGNYLYYSRLALVRGDCDESGGVGLVDYGCFHDCFDGPGQTRPDESCSEFDQDADGDVDLKDWAGFQNAFNGD